MLFAVGGPDTINDLIVNRERPILRVLADVVLDDADTVKQRGKHILAILRETEPQVLGRQVSSIALGCSVGSGRISHVESPFDSAGPGELPLSRGSLLDEPILARVRETVKRN